MLRAKAVTIKNYSGECLKAAINSTIEKKSVIITDGWSGYLRATEDRVHLEINSEKGANMPEIHRLIFNLKNWLRGTHHHVSTAHLQDYLNEFFFRFNFRNKIKSLPNLILQKMVELNKMPYNRLVAR